MTNTITQPMTPTERLEQVREVLLAYRMGTAVKRFQIYEQGEEALKVHIPALMEAVGGQHLNSTSGDCVGAVGAEDAAIRKNAEGFQAFIPGISHETSSASHLPKKGTSHE